MAKNFSLVASGGRYWILAGLVSIFCFALQSRPTSATASITEPTPHVIFRELKPDTTGINWSHNNARSAQRHLPETTGSGCAIFDYDNDGWMDLYFINSGPADFYNPATPLKNALYRNNRDGTFSDVTDQAGVAGGQFGMGVAAADYDKDGWQDLYVTNYGRNLLYHNNGDGTFSDVAAKAGVAVSGWSTSAAWFDYDNDNKLDLVVLSYAFYDKSQNFFCAARFEGQHLYCNPRNLRPTRSHLFRNNGDGTFANVDKEAGIAGLFGKGLGLVVTDVNNDRKMDLFIANDTTPNLLLINKGGRFEDVGTISGVAYSANGLARSGMGVDSADYDGDGWQDLFVANLDTEFFSLYHNEGDLTFKEIPGEIRDATGLLSGWGLKFFDFDNDGDPDLLLGNGHPEDLIEKVKQAVEYREPLLLFENRGGTFRNVSAESGSIFSKSLPARGLAIGDLDNDGDPDVVVTNNGDRPTILLNDGGNRNNFLGVELVARRSNAVGALITWQAGNVRHTRLKTTGGSYLSSHDPREILGLKGAKRVDKLEVHWPSGEIDRLSGLPVNRYIRIIEGLGVSKDRKRSQFSRF